MEKISIGKKVKIIFNDGTSKVDFTGKIGTVVNMSTSGDVIGIDFGKVFKGATWKLRNDILPKPTGRYFPVYNVKLIDNYNVDLI